MSSVPFNIGYNEEQRRSSRVLKPPGGGQSNIFGSDEPEPVSRRRNFTGRGESNIMKIQEEQQNGANSSDAAQSKKTESQTPDEAGPTKASGENAACNGDGDISTSTNEKSDKVTSADEKGDDNKTEKKPEASQPQPAPQTPIRRGRVPPGGFSTKLWISTSIGCHINMNDRDGSNNSPASSSKIPSTVSTASGDEEQNSSLDLSFQSAPARSPSLEVQAKNLRYGGQYFTAEQLPEFCDQLHNLVEIIRNIQEYSHITGEYPSEMERRLETEAREVASLAAEVRNACEAISRTRAQRHAVSMQRANLMEHLATVKEIETRELENTVRLSDRKIYKHWESVKNSKDPSVFDPLIEEISSKQSALECLLRLIENRKTALAHNVPPPPPRQPLPPPVHRDSSEEPSLGETPTERTENRRGAKRRHKEAAREARSVPLSGEPSRHEPVSHVTLYIEGTESASRQRVSSAGAITITPMELPSHGSVRDIVFFTTN